MRYWKSVALVTASMASTLILILSVFPQEKSSTVNSLVNKFVTTLLVIALQLPYATAAYAQSSPDTRSPVIELEALAESQADDAQVFTAQVVDDRVLKEVSLYHRRTGQLPFIPIVMQQIGLSGYYSASIDTDPTDLRAIEYYIQARDESGNRTVEGFAFDPYTRTLIANDTVIRTATPSSVVTSAATSDSISSKIRWWHVAAGILVVGALASASGGGDNGISDSSTATVPLTVNIAGP